MERKLTTGQPDAPQNDPSSRRASKAPPRKNVGQFYLLVFEGDSTRMVELPPSGDVTLGRAETAEVRLLHPGVEDTHARITLSDGEARLCDLDTARGTLVNGEAISESRLLGSADIITVGEITLVFHQSPRTWTSRPILEFNRFQRRAEEELRRSLRYHRPLALLAIRLGLANESRASAATKLEGQLRLTDIAAWDGADRMLILMPETTHEAAESAATRLLDVLTAAAPGARAGIAALPFDGCDVDALIASARAATSAAAPGRKATAAQSFRRIEIAERSVVIADPAMTQLYELVKRLAASSLPILICGETGTGKELLASAVHAWSARRERPLVPMNCAALQESLIESALFGHERGAFTGAFATKTGLLEQADGSTILLDEIGELSAAAQAKLLRVLETKRVARLGAVRDREIDIRIVAATNRDLEAQVKLGRFREDLFYRLKGALLWIPPLRDRTRELPLLAKEFLDDACAKVGRAPMQISYGAMQALSAYSWPGNVRELKNMMDFLAAATPDAAVEEWHVSERLGASRRESPVSSMRIIDEPTPVPPSNVRRAFRPIDEEIRELERARMAEALAAASGNQTRAAELIAMPLRTFVAKLKIYDIPRQRESLVKR